MAVKSVFELMVDIKASGERQLSMLDDRITKMGKSGANTAKSLATMTSILKGGAIVAAGAAVAGLARSLNEVYNAGDRLGALSASFARLAGDANSALEQLRGASMGGLTDEALMGITNKMYGLGLTTAQASKLIADGMRIAEATGRDATEAIDTLANAAIKGRPGALASLGVQVDLKKATDEYAASLGKTTAQLSETEKLQARLAAASGQVATAYGSIDMGNAVGEFERLRTTVQNGFGEMAKSAANFGDAFALALRGAGMASTDEQRLLNLVSDVANDLLRQAGKAKDGGKELVAAQIATIDQMIKNAQVWGAAGMDKWTGDQLQAQARFGDEAERVVARNADKIRAEALRLSLGDKEGAIAALQAMRTETERVGKAIAGNLAQQARQNTLLAEQKRLTDEAAQKLKDAEFSKRFQAELDATMKQRTADRLKNEQAIAAAMTDIAKTGIEIELAAGRINEAEAQRRRVALEVKGILDSQLGPMAKLAELAKAMAGEAGRRQKEAADKAKEDAEEAKRKAEAARQAGAAAAERRRAEAERVASEAAMRAKERADRIKALQDSLRDQSISLGQEQGHLSDRQAVWLRHTERLAQIARDESDMEVRRLLQREALGQRDLELAKIQAGEREAQERQSADTRERLRQEELENQRKAAERERYINQIRAQNAMQAAMALQAAGDMAGSQAGRTAAAFVQLNEATDQYNEAQAESEEAARAATPGLISASGAVTATLLKNQRAIAWVRAAFEAAASLASFAVGDVKGGLLHGAAAAMYGIAAGRSTPKASGASISAAPQAVAASTQQRAANMTINYYDQSPVRIGALTEAGEIVGKALNLAGQKGMKISPKLIPNYGGFGA